MKEREAVRASWEEIEAADFYWGVFGADDYSPEPLAIFDERDEAEDWLAWKRAHTDEDKRFGGGDYCVMAIRDLKGEAFNSYDPVPGGCTFDEPGAEGRPRACSRSGLIDEDGETRCARHRKTGRLPGTAATG